MLIDSVVITLIEEDEELHTRYILTVYGKGFAVYEIWGRSGGKKKFEIDVDDEEIVEILQGFKETGFFSLKNVYPVGDGKGEGIRKTISISIPKENDESVVKSVTYYESSKDVPERLRRLGDKIKKVVEIEIGEETVRGDEELVKLEKKAAGGETGLDKETIASRFKYVKNKNMKVVVGIGVLVVIGIVLLGLFLGVINLPFVTETGGNSNEGSTVPDVVLLTTGVVSSETGEYELSDSFQQGDVIHVYVRYTNVTVFDNGRCNVEVKLLFSVDETYRVYSFYEDTLKNFSMFNISTDETWETGFYKLLLTVFDNVSKKNGSAMVYFSLSKVPFEITKLLPASEVYGEGDYVEKYSFERDGLKPVNIYQEYRGFTVDENGSCNLYLELKVEKLTGGDKNITLTGYEYDGSKTWYSWLFYVDDTWPTGVYIVSVSILDNMSKKVVTDTTYFTLK
ncbi:MAG: hypothetical protein DRM98_03120 [Thermoplasmata archaeon]|nr:MAG: hypothetical protein DRM98_03120 [Thermoplasmata archaeon]